MTRFTGILGRGFQTCLPDARSRTRWPLIGVVAVAALALGLARGASAQTAQAVLVKSAPVVVAATGAAALVAPLDEQLQHLVTSSPAERTQLAARIVEICNGLAQVEGSPSRRIEAGYVIAASLYMGTDFAAAKDALVRGAEFATARGEVFEAANRYLDVVVLTIRQPVRTPEDVRQAHDFYGRARGLASSSLLSSEQRAFLAKRM